MKKNSLIIAMFLSMSLSVLAQESSRFSIETDPATFAFGGYAFHLRFQHKTWEHLLIGAGTYAMNMPDLLVSMNKNNADKGWNVRLNQGYSLFAERYFDEVNKGWFLGSQVGIQEYKLENEKKIGSIKSQNLLLMAYGGYSWQPFDFDLYIKPWGGLGYTSQIAGENILGGLEYDIAPITYFATLHIGYTF